jgi:hypothetical protein
MADLPIRELTPGQRFYCLGIEGRVLHHSAGSTTVRINRRTERSFVPTTGPNTGQEIRIVNGHETTQWSLNTPVEPAP